MLQLDIYNFLFLGHAVLILLELIFVSDISHPTFQQSPILHVPALLV